MQIEDRHSIIENLPDLSLRDLKKRASFSFLTKKERLEIEVAKIELNQQKLAEKRMRKAQELAEVDEDDGPKMYVSRQEYCMLKELQQRGH